MSKKPTKRNFQSSTVQYLYDRYIVDDPKRIESFEEEVLNAEIARKIYDLRTKAGLSQRELAKKIGTSASAICRLEDADYDGHSLSMLANRRGPRQARRDSFRPGEETANRLRRALRPWDLTRRTVPSPGPLPDLAVWQGNRPAVTKPPLFRVP